MLDLIRKKPSTKQLGMHPFLFFCSLSSPSFSLFKVSKEVQNNSSLFFFSLLFSLLSPSSALPSPSSCSPFLLSVLLPLLLPLPLLLLPLLRPLLLLWLIFFYSLLLLRLLLLSFSPLSFFRSISEGSA